MIRIIGIGSPFGDDAVGLAAARILAAAPPPDCEVVAADRPGASLVEMLEDADAIVLVDAVRSGASPGTVHEVSFDELEDSAMRFTSSHEFDLAAAIKLAQKLGRSSPRGSIIGLEIPPRSFDGIDALTPCTRDALNDLVTRVRQHAAKLNAANASG